MASFWDDVGRAITSFIATRQIPKANTTALDKSIKDLRHIVRKLSTPTMEGIEMGSPTPPPAGAVWIMQSDLDADAVAINGAYDILKGLVASGNLTQADESAVNTAIGNLEGLVAVPTPPVPPVDPTPPAV